MCLPFFVVPLLTCISEFVRDFSSMKRAGCAASDGPETAQFHHIFDSFGGALLSHSISRNSGADSR